MGRFYRTYQLSANISQQRIRYEVSLVFRYFGMLPFVGLSFVVWPKIAPSLTDQNSVFPAQPERSLPLKSDWNSCALAVLARTGSSISIESRFISLVTLVHLRIEV